MQKLAAGWIALGVALAAPMSVYAQDGTNPVTKHRTVHSVRIIHTVHIEHSAMVAPAPVVYTGSHGRGAPTEEIFSRNPEDCVRALCIGL